MKLGQLSIGTQKGIDAHLRRPPQTSASAKIEDQARITDRIPAEARGSDSRAREVALDTIEKVN